MHQHAIGCGQVFQRNIVVNRLFCNRGPASAKHENYQRSSILCARRLQYRLCRANRFCIRRRMPAVIIAESSRLRSWLHRTGNNALEIVPSLNFQRVHHGVRRFANGDHQHAVVRVEIVKVFADPQHTAFAGNMALEGAINAGFSQRTRENISRLNSHLNGDPFAIARCRRHGRIIRTIFPGCCSNSTEFYSNDSLTQVSMTQVSTASRSSRKRPSKKWSAPSTITNFFGSGSSATTFSSFVRGPN